MSDNVIQACKEFQEQLRGGQIQQLFNHLPEVYFVVKNRDGHVMMANGVAARLCGFEHEADMIGKYVDRLLEPYRSTGVSAVRAEGRTEP